MHDSLLFGRQIQRSATDGVAQEAEVTVEYEEVAGRYDDGTRFSLRQPQYAVSAETEPDIVISGRVAPMLAGAGLLEAVPRDTIEAMADPLDMDDDGISGEMAGAPDPSTGDIELGRFGWKASTVSLAHQTALAFIEDVGITTSLFPEQNCGEHTDCLAAPVGGDPEIDDARLELVVFYASTLAVPERRNLDDPAVKAGAELFSTIGCSACHVATLVTGGHPIPGLSHQTIHPFSDLLLHDMGPGLADNFPEGAANGSSWRTPPLWGIGLVEEVNDHTFFLHDGRARSLEEAILWHGGEAHAAQQRFVALDSEDRLRLIAFLESL